LNKQNNLGKVIRLFLANEKTKQRENKNEIILDAKGVIGDKFYGNSPSRTVLSTSIQSYELARENNIEINYGDLKENILVDFKIYSLNLGDMVKIGECILQISQNCTICSQLNKINEYLPNLLKKDRGIFIKVIKNGKIKVNDFVFLHKKGNY